VERATPPPPPLHAFPPLLLTSSPTIRSISVTFLALSTYFPARVSCPLLLVRLNNAVFYFFPPILFLLTATLPLITLSPLETRGQPPPGFCFSSPPPDESFSRKTSDDARLPCSPLPFFCDRGLYVARTHSGLFAIRSCPSFFFVPLNHTFSSGHFE